MQHWTQNGRILFVNIDVRVTSDYKCIETAVYLRRFRFCGHGVQISDSISAKLTFPNRRLWRSRLTRRDYKDACPINNSFSLSVHKLFY